MKNRSDKATQTPKKGSSNLKQNGKDQLGRKQSSESSDRDDEMELKARAEETGTKGRERKSAYAYTDADDMFEQQNEKQSQKNKKSGMSEFERGFYEGRKAYEHEMRSKQYGQSSGNGHGDRYSGQRYGSTYGEHPQSRGSEEYRGSNKRHSGLGYHGHVEGAIGEGRNRDTQRFRTSGRSGGSEHVHYNPREEQDRYSTRYSEGKFPEDRNFEEFDMDHDYQNEGHQSFGETEGFGFRSGQQQGQDWEEQDNYRDGNAPVKRGKGRYGSR
jgi:ubiquitin